MNESLFPLEEYPSDFNAQWREYKPPRAASKRDGYKAWMQTRVTRPQHDLMLLCIAEYLCDLQKTKQHKCHFASWLRKAGWEGYLDDAKHRLANPRPSERVLKPFRASDYDIPQTGKLRPVAEILAAHRAKNGA